MALSQSANAFIRQPNATNVNTNETGDPGAEAEINAIGVVVIVIILVVLFSVWVGLAQWPRGKIRAWRKRRSTNKLEKARRKALSANSNADKALTAGTLGMAASAVALTQADIEAAVGNINTRVAGKTQTLPPALEKNASQASTVVIEKSRDLVKDAATDQDENQEATLAKPSRAIVRGSSLPKLPFISPGSPFGSMKFKNSMK